MKYLALVFFTFMCCCNYSCKKKIDNISELINTDTDSPKVNYREKYVGVYRMYIQTKDYSYSYYHDTFYTTIMKIEYHTSDTIAYAHDGATNSMLYMPSLLLYDNISGKLYKTIGVDTAGKIYNGMASFSFQNGGFIGTDSINCYIGFSAPHDGHVDSIRGHKL